MNAFVGGTTITVRRSTLTELDRLEWDLFAQSCNASFKCSVCNVGSDIARLLFGRRMFFNFYACNGGSETKIGQCALRSFDGAFHFEDRLLTLPDFDEYWTACMRVLLTEIGRGRFHYGSLWNMDRSRHELVAGIDGATLVDVTGYRMQFVDFGRLTNWEQYAQSLHRNVQRNLKKAASGNGEVRIEIRRGLSAARLLAKSSALRKFLYDSKGKPFSKASALIRAAFRTLSFRRYAVSAAVIDGNQAAGVFSGLQFGNAMFYIDGGSLPRNRGLSWSLLIAMIRTAYETAPTGFFIFGWELEGSTDAPDLIWSRRQCNIAEKPSSLFEFIYEPG